MKRPSCSFSLRKVNRRRSIWQTSFDWHSIPVAARVNCLALNGVGSTCRSDYCSWKQTIPRQVNGVRFPSMKCRVRRLLTGCDSVQHIARQAHGYLPRKTEHGSNWSDGASRRPAVAQGSRTFTSTIFVTPVRPGW